MAEGVAEGMVAAVEATPVSVLEEGLMRRRLEMDWVVEVRDKPEMCVFAREGCRSGKSTVREGGGGVGMLIGTGWVGRSNMGVVAYGLFFLFSAPFPGLFISGGGLEDILVWCFCYDVVVGQALRILHGNRERGTARRGGAWPVSSNLFTEDGYRMTRMTTAQTTFVPACKSPYTRELK